MKPTTSTNANGRPRWDRADWIVLLALCVVSAAMTFAVIRAPSIPGFREDDGVYLATAKALAEGHGYRHPHLPGEPHQTKYPILYPFVLSVVWRVFPEFPANLVPMQVLNALFALGAAGLAYRLARRVWRLPAVLAGCGVLLAVVNPIWIEKVQETMSEHLYALLAMAALTFATPDARAGENDSGRRPRMHYALLVGLLAGAACLTRSIGVTLIGAVVVSLLLCRRWRDATLAGTVSAFMIGGWLLWRHGAATANAAIPQAAAFGYDLDYGAWAPQGVGDVLWVAWLNAADMAYSLFADLGYVPLQWAGKSAAAGSAWALYACLAVTVALCGVGLASAWRRSNPVIHIYALFYFGLVLIWPFTPTTRFFLPLLPFLTIAALLGLVRALSPLLRFIDGPRATPSTKSRHESGEREDPLRTVPAAWDERMTLVVVLCTILLGGAWIRADFKGGRARQAGVLAKRRAEAVALVRQRTPPDAVIAGGQGAYFFLATGRRFVPLIPIEDPIGVFYTRDRSFGRFGRERTPGELEFYLQLARDRQLAYYRTAGVTHVISWAEIPRRVGPVTWFQKFNPGMLTLIAETGPENERYRLFAMQTPPKPFR